MPSAPLCEYIPTLPGGGAVGAKVASSRTAGSVLSTPIQLGPTIRIPDARTVSNSLSSSVRPADEASAKPDVITTTPCTCALAQSSIAAYTSLAGTATSARSTGAPIATTLG